MQIKKKTQYFFGIIIIGLLLMVVGCTQKIADIKDPKYVGKTVTIKGTVKNSIKIGSLSAYTLEDDSGESIGVSSETLQKEGTQKTVKGVLIKDSLFGYYIKTD